jgi:DNA-binding beta-propeller fold protein YncE
VSPGPPVAPAGRLIDIGPSPEGIVATADGLIAVAVRGSRPGIDLFRATQTTPKFIPVNGSARHLALAGPDGPLLVPVETADQLEEIALPSGKLIRMQPTGRQPHDAAASGSTVAVSDEFGDSLELIDDAGHHTVSAPLQPGGIAADSDAFVVVGVRARVIEAYRPDGKIVARAACGDGPTHVVAGPDGYFYVADTNGGTLLVFGLVGRSLRQVARIAIGPRPYGLAGG